MNKYWKAYGALIGSAIGVAAVHGFVPEGAETHIVRTLETLGPIIGATIGTWLAPKNAG